MQLRNSVTTAFAILLMSVPLLTFALPLDLYLQQRNLDDDGFTTANFPTLKASTSAALMGSRQDGETSPVWYHPDNTLCVSPSNSTTQSNAGYVLSVCDIPALNSQAAAFYNFMDIANGTMAGATTTLLAGADGLTAGLVSENRLTTMESSITALFNLVANSGFNPAKFFGNSASTTQYIASSTAGLSERNFSPSHLSKLNALSTTTISATYPISYNSSTGVISTTLSTTTPQEFWVNGSKQTSYKVVSIASTTLSGVSTMYLTDNGLSTGNALCPTSVDSIQPFIDDNANTFGVSKAVTNSNKTLTLTVNVRSFSSTTILGISVLGSSSLAPATNGTSVSALIHCH